MATSNFGVVAVIQPPLLKSVDQPALIKFETAFAAYRAKVEDVNKDRDEDAKLSVATVKDCTAPDVLHALCVMGDIEGAQTLEEATPEKVQDWFDKASGSSPKDLSERIDAALRLISFTPSKEDPAGGVSNFIISVITALDQKNASEILKDTDLAKKFLDRLVRKFHPDVLQERIRMMRRGSKKEQLASIKLFRDEVSNIALEFALTKTARARVNPRKVRNAGERNRATQEASGTGRERETPNANSATPNRRPPKRKESEWNQECLNEHCTGVHPLKDCPITSSEKKKELFEKHYGNKKSKKAKTVTEVSNVTEGTPNESEGRFRVALEDSVFDTVLGGSGADFSAIDAKTFEKVRAAVPDITVKTLPLSLSRSKVPLRQRVLLPLLPLGRQSLPSPYTSQALTFRYESEVSSSTLLIATWTRYCLADLSSIPLVSMVQLCNTV